MWMTILSCLHSSSFARSEMMMWTLELRLRCSLTLNRPMQRRRPSVSTLLSVGWSSSYRMLSSHCGLSAISMESSLWPRRLCLVTWLVSLVTFGQRCRLFGSVLSVCVFHAPCQSLGLLAAQRLQSWMLRDVSCRAQLHRFEVHRWVEFDGLCPMLLF